MCFSTLHQEHPILHALTIYAKELWKEGKEGEPLKFTRSGSIVTVLNKPCCFNTIHASFTMLEQGGRQSLKKKN